MSVLLDGAAALETNYGAFDAKIGELVNRIGGLAYQMSELSTAVNTLVAEYGKLDNGMKGYTDAVAKIVASFSQITDGASKLVSGSGVLKMEVIVYTMERENYCLALWKSIMAQGR